MVSVSSLQVAVIIHNYCIINLHHGDLRMWHGGDGILFSAPNTSKKMKYVLLSRVHVSVSQNAAI